MTQTLYHGHVSSLDRSKTLGWHLSQCFRGLGRLRILPLGLVLIMCDLNLKEYCAEQVVEEVLAMHGSPVISKTFQLLIVVCCCVAGVCNVGQVRVPQNATIDRGVTRPLLNAANQEQAVMFYATHLPRGHA